MKPILLATDFSGLGSPEEALKRLNAPHRVVFACENDKYARASYLANHKPEIFYDDVTTRDNDSAPYSDLYVFGFPCQAFSIAGKQLGFEDMRGTLVFNSADYIRKKRPRVFVGENVKGLLSHDGGRTFRTIIDTFAISENGRHNMFHKVDCLGYHVFYQVLNTKNFGVPQNRERIFIVGFRDEADALNFRFPKGFPLELELKDLLQDNPNYVRISKEVRSEQGKAIRKENMRNGFDYNPQRAKELIFEEKETVNTITTSLTRDNMIMVDDSNCFQVPEKYYLSEKALDSIIKNQNNLQKPAINPDVAATLQSPGNACGTYKGANFIAVSEATKQGYAVAEPGDSINLSVPTSATRRGRVGKGQANTLDTQCNQAVVIDTQYLFGTAENSNAHRIVSDNVIYPTMSTGSGKTAYVGIKNGIRIRRLTPRECFRLQGYSDQFFDNCAAVNSDTQLYKQAGNSITVDTIMYLIKNILKAMSFFDERSAA